MPDALATGQLVTILAFAIPGAALATLLLILVVSRRRRKAHSTITRLTPDMHHDDDGAQGHAARADTAAGEPQGGTEPAAGAGLSAQRRLPHARASEAGTRTVEVTTVAALTTSDAPAAACAAAPDVVVTQLVERIAATETAGETAKLAQLYLDLARAYRADNRPHDALAALRSAAGFGAMHGPKAVHAMARVELGEAALHAGDRTGACEQWQIAKIAFHEEGLKDAYNATDKRMRDNGCPTDWVLTEF